MPFARVEMREGIFVVYCFYFRGGGGWMRNVGAWLRGWLFMECLNYSYPRIPLTRRSGHAVRAVRLTIPAQTGSLSLNRNLINMTGTAILVPDHTRFTICCRLHIRQWTTFSRQRRPFSAEKYPLRFFWNGVCPLTTMTIGMMTDLTELDTHGGRLFYELPRNDQDTPDYYFTTKSHTNFYHPYVSLVSNIDLSHGIVVLDAEWILDSLHTQRLLPDKHYIVYGLPTSRISWSTTQYFMAEIDIMKWFGGSVWATSTSKQTKRVFEEEVELQSRKKRVSVAINDVEAALSRLREVTGTEPPKISPPNIKYNTDSPQIEEGSDAAAAGTQFLGGVDLSEAPHVYVQTEEDRDILGDGEYLTAHESSSVKFEEEDLEKLLDSFERARPSRPTTSVKCESPESIQQPESLELSESDELDDGWTSNENLTHEILEDEMEESYDDEDVENEKSSERNEFDNAWDTPNTSNKDESDDDHSDDEEIKCYRSLVRARTSFEHYDTHQNGGRDDTLRRETFNRIMMEGRTSSDQRKNQERSRKKDRQVKYHEPFESDYGSGLNTPSNSHETTKPHYYGTPEVKDEWGPYRSTADRTNFFFSRLGSSPDLICGSPLPAPKSRDSQQHSASDLTGMRQSPDQRIQFLDEHPSTSGHLKEPHDRIKSEIRPDESNLYSPLPEHRSQSSSQHFVSNLTTMSQGSDEDAATPGTDKDEFVRSPVISAAESDPSSPDPLDSSPVGHKYLKDSVNYMCQVARQRREALHNGNQHSDEHSATSRSSQYHTSLGNTWLKRTKPQSPKSYGSPSLDSFSDGHVEGMYRSPSPLPCITTAEESHVTLDSAKGSEKPAQLSRKVNPFQTTKLDTSSNAKIESPYSFSLPRYITPERLRPSEKSPPKEHVSSHQPSPKGAPPAQLSLDIDHDVNNTPSPQNSTPQRTGFTPINEISPLKFPTFSPVIKEPGRPLFAAERFSTYITPRSPARQARLESANKLKTLFHHNFNDKVSASSEDIYLPNLKSTSPELDIGRNPLRVSVGSSVLTGERGDDIGGAVEVWEARCLEMGEKRIRVMRIGKSVRDSGEICL